MPPIFHLFGNGLGQSGIELVSRRGRLRVEHGIEGQKAEADR